MINRRLYDILIKHQIYIEGFKNFQLEKFRKELPKLIKQLRDEFRNIPYKSLDEMTKRELLEFQRNIKTINNNFFDYWNKILIKDMEEFLAVDFKINKAILANTLIDSKELILDEKEIDKIIEDNSRKEDDNKIFPFAWIFGNELDKMNNSINNSYIPAVGKTQEYFLDTLGLIALNKIQSAINTDFADNVNVSEIEDDVIGTQNNNYKDGVIIGIDRSNAAISNTVIQNITSLISASIFATAFDLYIWLSVMDSRTSDICISRNRKVYKYGKGPLPPAHAHCRSKTAPYDGTDYPQESFEVWTGNQSAEIQDYVKNKFPPLSLEEYGSKLESILTV